MIREYHACAVKRTVVLQQEEAILGLCSGFQGEQLRWARSEWPF